MGNKRQRYAVEFDPELKEFIEKEATFNRTSVASRIEFIVDQYRLQKMREMEFFRPVLREVGPDAKTPQHFVTPARPAPEHVYRFRENADQEKT